MSLENLPDFLLNFSECDVKNEEKYFYCFKSFRLDVEERQLLHKSKPVALTPKAFDVLVALVERGGHLVAKDELLQLIWADSFVEEANIARIIHTLRKTLGEDENGDKFIETVPTRGYRFIAEVSHESALVVSPAKHQNETTASNFELDGQSDIAAFAEPAHAARETPQKSSQKLILAGFIGLIAVALVSFFALAWNSQGTSNAGKTVTIAVLPFNSVSDADRDETKNLQLAFLLINQLKQSKKLKVSDFSAIKVYTDVKQDAVAIGDKLKTEYVLESNYVKNGGQLLVTSELHNIKNGEVETFNYKVDLADRFKADSTILSNIGKDLLAKLNFEPVNFADKRGTSNEKAWEFYWQGMTLTDKRILEDAEKAIANFEKAIELDPNYARAYAGLAYAHTTVKVNGGNVPTHCRKALETSQRAISLDANLADAYTILGMNQHSCQWNQIEAEKSHRKAVELDPNSPFTHRFYGIFLTHSGRPDESLRELKIAKELDPESLFTEKQMGRALFFGRRWDEAIEQLKKTRERDSNDSEQAGFIFQAYENKGDLENAFDYFLITEAINQSKQTDKPEDVKKTEIEAWKKVFAEAGWQGVLRRRLSIAEQKVKAGGDNFGEIASLAARLGDKDKAFAFLEKELPLDRLYAVQILVDPMLDSLRSDPRFEALVKPRWKTE